MEDALDALLDALALALALALAELAADDAEADDALAALDEPPELAQPASIAPAPAATTAMPPTMNDRLDTFES